MSDPNVQDFDRVISLRSLARVRFLPAVACALFSAMALACALVCVSAGFWLLVHVDSASATAVVRTTGLLDSAKQESWDDLTALASQLLQAPMAFLTLGLGAEQPVEVDQAEMIDTSFPGFVEAMRGIGADISEVA